MVYRDVNRDVRDVRDVNRGRRAIYNIYMLVKILEKRRGKPFKVHLNLDDVGGRLVGSYHKYYQDIFIRNMGDIINYEGILRYADKINEQKKHRTALIESM